MKLKTGSQFKTSPSSPTGPFLHTASCLNPNVSSSRRPRRRAGPTSPPFHCHLLSVFHPSGCLTIFPKYNKCGYSHLQARAQLMQRSATAAVARSITLPCAKGTEDPSTLPQQQSQIIPVGPIEGKEDQPLPVPPG